MTLLLGWNQINSDPLSLLRIVAARLNGSLDFFTVEINKPPCLLQYRGQRDRHEPLTLP